MMNHIVRVAYTLWRNRVDFCAWERKRGGELQFLGEGDLKQKSVCYSKNGVRPYLSLFGKCYGLGLELTEKTYSLHNTL